MVSIEQVTEGLIKYIREYLVGQIPKDSWKYIAGNVGLEMIEISIRNNQKEFSNKIINKLDSNELFKMFNFITQDGMIDVDTMHKIAPKYMSNEGFPIHIPMIGDFTILPTDIDILYNCIVQNSVKYNGGVR